MCTKVLGRSCVYPRVVKKPAHVPNALKMGVRLTPCVPGCQAGIALYIYIHTYKGLGISKQAGQTVSKAHLSRQVCHTAADHHGCQARLHQAERGESQTGFGHGPAATAAPPHWSAQSPPLECWYLCMPTTNVGRDASQSVAKPLQQLLHLPTDQHRIAFRIAGACTLRHSGVQV